MAVIPQADVELTWPQIMLVSENAEDSEACYRSIRGR